MRGEKNAVLEEYRSRISEYEQCLHKNSILRSFVENWRSNVEQNREMVGRLKPCLLS